MKRLKAAAIVASFLVIGSFTTYGILQQRVPTPRGELATPVPSVALVSPSPTASELPKPEPIVRGALSPKVEQSVRRTFADIVSRIHRGDFEGATAALQARSSIQSLGCDWYGTGVAFVPTDPSTRALAGRAIHAFTSNFARASLLLVRETSLPPFIEHAWQNHRVVHLTTPRHAYVGLAVICYPPQTDQVDEAR